MKIGLFQICPSDEGVFQVCPSQVNPFQARTAQAGAFSALFAVQIFQMLFQNTVKFLFFHFSNLPLVTETGPAWIVAEPVSMSILEIYRPRLIKR